ncbi:MAG: 30S ribosomal protein S17 [Candidatus Diapherotrites archaeon]
MENCNDPKCPKCGNIKVRGNIFTGIVTSAKADKTVTVERQLVKKVRKYERYKKIRSKIHAHNSKCVSAKEGDTVRIGETRKLSKTKSFVVMDILNKGSDEKPKTDKKKVKK